jgi:catechol 2,3-dioxygenase-like lactoylglutathione lyase family enzyme
MIQSISAITLATTDMRRAVRFYRMLGFRLAHGGEEAAFSSFFAGSNFLNLIAEPAALPGLVGTGDLLRIRSRCALFASDRGRVPAPRRAA